MVHEPNASPSSSRTLLTVRPPRDTKLLAGVWACNSAFDVARSTLARRRDPQPDLRHKVKLACQAAKTALAVPVVIESEPVSRPRLEAAQAELDALMASVDRRVAASKISCRRGL